MDLAQDESVGGGGERKREEKGDVERIAPDNSVSKRLKTDDHLSQILAGIQQLDKKTTVLVEGWHDLDRRLARLEAKLAKKKLETGDLIPPKDDPAP